MTFYRLEVYDTNGHVSASGDYPDLSTALDRIVDHVNRDTFGSLALYQCTPTRIFTYTNPRRPGE